MHDVKTYRQYLNVPKILKCIFSVQTVRSLNKKLNWTYKFLLYKNMEKLNTGRKVENIRLEFCQKRVSRTTNRYELVVS